MRNRAIILVAGPSGTGKTSLIEQILRSFDGFILVARCVRDDSIGSFRESSPRTHSELRRYRKAGASGTALFTYPRGDIDYERMFTTKLLEDFSHAIVFEADHVLPLGDLHAHVVLPPAAGQALLVRKMRDRAAEEREKANTLERLAREPEGIREYFTLLFGQPASVMLRGSSDLVAKARETLLAEAWRARSTPPPPSTEHWSIAPGYEGTEQAQLVIVNVREQVDHSRAERMLTDIARIRKDPHVFRDVLGWRGRKTPITAVAANLEEARHPGTKKVIARIKRAVRAV